jgi:hypothetical protein
LATFKLPQDLPMLKYRRKQAENSEGDKTQTENQGAVDGIDPFPQASRLQISMQLAETEAKANEREGGAHPRHERSVCSFPTAFSGELS